MCCCCWGAWLLPPLDPHGPADEQPIGARAQLGQRGMPAGCVTCKPNPACCWPAAVGNEERRKVLDDIMVLLGDGSISPYTGGSARWR